MSGVINMYLEVEYYFSRSTLYVVMFGCSMVNFM